MEANGDDVSAYPNPKDDPKGLMDEKYDDTDLGKKLMNLYLNFKLMVRVRRVFSIT